VDMCSVGAMAGNTSPVMLNELYHTQVYQINVLTRCLHHIAYCSLESDNLCSLDW